MSMVTISEAAKITGLPRGKIYKMIRRGEICSERTEIKGTVVILVDPDTVQAKDTKTQDQSPSTSREEHEKPMDNAEPKHHKDDKAKTDSDDIFGKFEKDKRPTGKDRIRDIERYEATLRELMKILESAPFLLLREKDVEIEKKSIEIASLRQRIRELKFDDAGIIKKCMSEAEKIAIEFEAGFGRLLPIIERIVKMIASTSMNIARFIGSGEKHWRRVSRQ